VADYKVKRLEDLEHVGYNEARMGRVRHELGISAFGVNSYVAEDAGSRLIDEHAEDQEGDPEELYVVLRGRARFEVGDDTFDAPQGTLVFVPPGPNRRTAFAEEAGTTILAVGAAPGKAYEPDGWEIWGPLHSLYEAGDYEGVIANGREAIEANPQYGMPLYNLACAESLGGHPEEALEHLRMAIEAAPMFREMAGKDSDFDAIRDQPGFRELVA
jgi:tetratricopeptide (TPR) repeat protein